MAISVRSGRPRFAQIDTTVGTRCWRPLLLAERQLAADDARFSRCEHARDVGLPDLVEAVAQTHSVRPAKTIPAWLKNFIESAREQGFLLPPDVRDWLPADHLAWFVIDAVAEMDLAAF
jgi:hypothetical protein